VAALALMAGAGQWLQVSADVPQVAANTWASAGDFGAMPDGTASAPLNDGRIVVAGGHSSDGTLVSQVGIYDPALQSWQDGGQLATARTGHTASTLPDGRVLIAGGRTATGPSSDVEIYNPGTRQSVHAGDMWIARVNHAAADLGNGKVLLVGGSNGSGFLDYVELFDSETGQTESLIVRLAVAREKLTATRLLDGHVLIAGGRNESGNLAIAEIFVSGSHSIFETGSLRTPRSGHAAVLLPNNNQVLIAGGTVDGAPAASAELYADWRDGFRAVPNPMSQARADAVAGVLPQHDLAFVGGGGSPSGDYFGYATVKTDRADYWPGETVTITGSGWQPGETVTLKISEDADTHNDFTYTAVADAQGNIVNTEFAPIENEVFHHFGMRFYLTATGAASTALNTFTDGNSTVTGTVVQSGTNAPISGAIVTCASGCNGNPPPSTATLADGTYLLAVQFPGNVGTTVTLTVSANGYVGQTSAPFTAGHQQIVQNKNFSLEPNVRPTSTSVVCAPDSIAVNASSTCTATVSDTGTGTATVPGGSVAFASNSSGTFDVPSCTLSGSPASCAVVYTATARGTGTHAITGSYSATSSHTNSNSAAFNLTVNKANQATLNLTTPASLVYGTPGTASVTGGSGDGAVTFSAGSSTGCSVNATTGAIAVTNASGNCAITAEKTSDDNYLVATAGPNTVALEKADAEVTVAGFSGTYDAQPHGATGTATGVGEADLSSQLDLGATFTNAPGGTANWTFTGGDNYVSESGSVQIVINKADATVSVSGYTGTYDGNPHGATGAATGVGGVALPGLNLGDSFTNVPGGTANWTFEGGTNYEDESGNVEIVIDPKAASVKADDKTKTYGDPNPALTATAEDVVAGDTLNYSLSTSALQFSWVGNYPITVTPGDNPNYVVTAVQGTLAIETRPATIKANDKEKAYNTDNPLLDAVVTGTVNGDVLDYTLATTATKTSDVGVYPIVVTVGSNPNYAVVPTDGTLTIVKATQQITFPAIGPKNYGDVFTVSASASSGLAVTFAASGSCSVAGAVVTVNAVGSCTVIASQAGNNNYLAAPNVPQTFDATYTWSGVLQPINQEGSSIFKLGSTIPVKFQLTGASASITNLAAKIYVAKVSNGAAGNEYEALTNANADAGNQFRYDPAGQLYIYNWGTKLSGAGLIASEGTWQIRIDLLDGAVHTVLVTLKK
jgi:hypothetical protein